MSKPTDLVQGTLDLLILRVLALEPLHGWGIAQRIRHMSSDVLQVGQSALYPALHKLERQGWITSEEAANWERLSAAISEIVRAV
jgi:PadR family transcriptional regulator PadR